MRLRGQAITGRCTASMLTASAVASPGRARVEQGALAMTETAEPAAPRTGELGERRIAQQAETVHGRADGDQGKRGRRGW